MEIEPILDKKRHLICIPYSLEGLHKMALKLGIKRCWFHSGKYPHYDIPKRRKEEFESKYGTIPTRELWKIIKSVI